MIYQGDEIRREILHGKAIWAAYSDECEAFVGTREECIKMIEEHTLWPFKEYNFKSCPNYFQVIFEDPEEIFPDFVYHFARLPSDRIGGGLKNER